MLFKISFVRIQQEFKWYNYTFCRSLQYAVPEIDKHERLSFVLHFVVVGLGKSSANFKTLW